MKRFFLMLAVGNLGLVSGSYADDVPPTVRPPAEVKPFVEKAEQPAAKSELAESTKETVPAVVPPASVSELFCPANLNEGPRVWANAELLLWWMKPPSSRPLLTTGSENDPFPGAIGQPNTRVLYGENDGAFGTQPGLRLSIGGWLDRDHDIGVEFGLMYFGQNDGEPFSARRSNLYIPVDIADSALPGRFIISDPVAGFNGSASFSNSIRFWGMDSNALFNMHRDDDCHVTGLVGLRYLDLSERLSTRLVSDDLFLGGTLTLDENYRTRTQFYGGQIGLQTDVQQGRWFASLRTLFAMGVNHQARDFRALSQITTPPAGNFPDGVFVQGTNAGRATDNAFSVVPQVGLKLGMDLLPFMRLFAGYDFLYWTNVIRPHNELDSTVNFTQAAGGALFGTPRPLPQFRNTDIWMHGVTFGMELRY